MSFDLEPRRVTAVLLADGRWHQVDNNSLKIDTISFERAEGLFSVPGLRFLEEVTEGGRTNRRTIVCPLSSVHGFETTER